MKVKLILYVLLLSTFSYSCSKDSDPDPVGFAFEDAIGEWQGTLTYDEDGSVAGDVKLTILADGKIKGAYRFDIGSPDYYFATGKLEDNGRLSILFPVLTWETTLNGKVPETNTITGTWDDPTWGTNGSWTAKKVTK